MLGRVSSARTTHALPGYPSTVSLAYQDQIRTLSDFRSKPWQRPSVGPPQDLGTILLSCKHRHHQRYEFFSRKKLCLTDAYPLLYFPTASLFLHSQTRQFLFFAFPTTIFICISETPQQLHFIEVGGSLSVPAKHNSSCISFSFAIQAPQNHPTPLSPSFHSTIPIAKSPQPT